jgi:hypothetical protein
MIPVMVIVIVPELEGLGPQRFSAVIFIAESARVGGFEWVDMRVDPPTSEVALSKISAKAKSEAKYRKRSDFMLVQSLPQIPLDNHKPRGVQFL